MGTQVENKGLKNTAKTKEHAFGSVTERLHASITPAKPRENFLELFPHVSFLRVVVQNSLLSYGILPMHAFLRSKRLNERNSYGNLFL